MTNKQKLFNVGLFLFYFVTFGFVMLCLAILIAFLLNRNATIFTLGWIVGGFLTVRLSLVTVKEDGKKEYETFKKDVLYWKKQWQQFKQGVKKPEFWQIQGFNMIVLIGYIALFTARIALMWGVFQFIREWDRLLAEAAPTVSENLLTTLFLTINVVLLLGEATVAAIRTDGWKAIRIGSRILVLFFVSSLTSTLAIPYNESYLYSWIIVSSIGILLIRKGIEVGKKAFSYHILPIANHRKITVVYWAKDDLNDLIYKSDSFLPIKEAYLPFSFIRAISYTKQAYAAVYNHLLTEEPVRTKQDWLNTTDRYLAHLDTFFVDVELALLYSPINLKVSIPIKNHIPLEHGSDWPPFLAKFARKKRIICYDSKGEHESCLIAPVSRLAIEHSLPDEESLSEKRRRQLNEELRQIRKRRIQMQASRPARKEYSILWEEEYEFLLQQEERIRNQLRNGVPGKEIILMEVVQLVDIDGRELVFEDHHDEICTVLVSQEVADEYRQLLTEAEAEGEPMIVERSSLELLRENDGI